MAAAADNGEDDPTAPVAITRAALDTMVAGSRAAAPLEACGMLGGTGGRITACYELTNADASPVHYRMLPEEQFAAVRDMRARKLAMAGVWHSHPARPARMSAEDLRLAFTAGVAYVVVSLEDPRAPVVRAFRVRDGRSTGVSLEVIEENE